MISKKIIAGNWKQNGTYKSSMSLAERIISSIHEDKHKHEIILFPPSLYLLSIQGLQKKKKVKLGSQNVSAYKNGAYTGEISASMLKDMKIDYCLVGHSERRHVLNETEKILSDKVSRLFENNINIIYCIGETLREYRQKKTKLVLRRQIKRLIKSNQEYIKKQPKKIVIAYEPVWAIGTGLVPTLTELASIFNFIRCTIDKEDTKYSSIKVLYGGSVTPDNAASLMETSHMDGLLVGGASLISKKFIDICSTI